MNTGVNMCYCFPFIFSLNLYNYTRQTLLLTHFADENTKSELAKVLELVKRKNKETPTQPPLEIFLNPFLIPQLFKPYTSFHSLLISSLSPPPPSSSHSIIFYSGLQQVFQHPLCFLFSYEVDGWSFMTCRFNSLLVEFITKSKSHLLNGIYM